MAISISSKSKVATASLASANSISSPTSWHIPHPYQPQLLGHLVARNTHILITFPVLLAGIPF
eukprot:scaffold168326_cov50-Cyclotella_meneghiniana.AAC.1